MIQVMLEYFISFAIKILQKERQKNAASCGVWDKA